MLESFMEDLLWKYPDDFFPRHGFKQAARQFTLSDGGRLDISFRDASERLWVVEVKAVAIRTEVADQVYRYAQKLREARPNDPPIPAVVAPIINSTVREHFDRWGIEHFEISEATFRRVATERGVEIDAQEQAPEVADGRAHEGRAGRALGSVGRFKTVLGYAIWCQRGECDRCNYKGCECPHHPPINGKADLQIIDNCRKWAPTYGGWIGSACQELRHTECRKRDCGCRCEHPGRV